MFELLLQADRALAKGALDQAERTYWQLVELDPTNAMAVAGLARVWLERGYERSARTFADRALSIDPDSVAARRILEEIAREGPQRPAQEQSALPLLAAERLEALSRRRGKDVGGEGGDVVAKKAGARGGAARGKATATPAPPIAPAQTEATAKKAGRERPAGAEPVAPSGRGAATGETAPRKESRGRTRPDQAPLPAGPLRVGALPAEPLRDRRQAGRLAAAAAAAAAAAREPLRPRHEPHHAMPIGRRLYVPAQLKSPPGDAFSAAEMAAAVEAIDAVDDNGGTGLGDMPGAARNGARQADGQSDRMSAVDATAADDSIALRIALVTDAGELEAAEQEASAREASEDSFEAAEAMAGAANFLPVEPGPDRTVEPSSGTVVQSRDTHSVEPADADAVEAAARAEAIGNHEPAPLRKQFEPTVGGGPSEEEAEAEALREAIAIVLQGDGNIAEAEPSPSDAEPAQPVECAQPVESAGHSEASSPREPAASSEPPESQDGSDSSTRKHGLFHRIRGS